MATQLQLVVVTPETTLIDEPVTSVTFPLFDGQIGVLPGRTPLVGRLGCGQMRVTTATSERLYFIDGGFSQVRGGVVTLLTSRCVEASAVDATAAEAELLKANSRPASSDTEIDSRLRDQERARRMLAVARR